MSERRESPLTGVVSLGLSLALAAVLLVMTVSADSDQPPPEPPQVENNDVTAEPPAPDLSIVVLPPPPVVAAAPKPATPPLPPEPPTRPELPAEAPEPPAPEPAVRRVAAPEPRPEPEIASRPPPKPESKPVEITPEAVREGRALLRLLERGEGPDIEIAWPAASADRAELYRLFNNCFGMRTVVMSLGGEMFGARGEPFDGDRYSGYARQPSGGLSADERAQVEAIRRRHGLVGGSVLRLFPRRVDAVLLGALDRIASGDFDKGARIRARYQATANGVQVADIQVDGRAANQTILLPYSVQQTCR